MRLSRRRARRAAIALALVGALAGCSADTQPAPAPSSSAPALSPTPTATATQPPPLAPLAFHALAPTSQAAVIDLSDPVRAALGASRTLFAAAPVVVLAPAPDAPAQLTAASAAVALGAPLLLVAPVPPPGTGAAPGPTTAPTPDPDADLRAELTRLGTRAVLAVGDAAAPSGMPVVRVPAGATAAALAAATGRAFGAPAPVPAGGEQAAVGALARPATSVLGGSSPSLADPRASTAPGIVAPSLRASPMVTVATLPRTVPPAPPAASVALTGAGPVPLAVLATVRAAGLPLVDVPGADPRAGSAAVTAIAAANPAHVVALGAAFGPADRLAERIASAQTGVQLPGGGQVYFPQDDALPGKRYVALYGSPGMASLGVLGEQDVPATIARAQAHADPYRSLTTDTVVPGVEIIATIASAGPGPDGNYSTERPVDELAPLVHAAGDAGLTVVLDLQPGRADFLTQAQQYEPLLELPYVSLALDPEWRLGPDQLPLKQIGSVGIDEVNAVAAWLAQLVADHHLPQKMLVLHQFMQAMVQDRDRLDTSHDELALVVHVDGQGGQAAKVGTWNTVRQGAPAGIHWGWKNFYDEDKPAMLTPPATYAITPTPDLVTYQ